jgi:hypothetical protein
MNNSGWVILAILCAYGCAVVAPLLRQRLPGRFGALAGWCLVPIVLLCPMLIPSAHVGLRALSAVLSGDLTFKIVEYFRHCRTVERGIGLGDYYRFLIPFPVFSTIYPDHKRRLPRPEIAWPQALRLVVGIVGVVIALWALRALSRFDLIRSSFALDHGVMLLTFVLAIESLSRALCGLERLAGFDTTPIVQDAYLSRSVAEFWQRYNGRVRDWFYRNVFQPSGGRRAPVRSMLLVFFVSGLFHELAFAVATSRVTGYQFAFFTIQGPAALASGRLERLARRGGLAGKVAAHGATMLFIAITSVLFFDGVSKIFPFIYAGRSPLP